MDDRENYYSWFIVWNNPYNELEGLVENTPEAIAEYVLAQFIGDSDTRSGAVAYCVSAQGLQHLHIVACSINKMRFSALKKIWPKAHLEPTRGSKKQADDYIHKRGSYAEKGEQVLYIAQKGEIRSNQGSRTDLNSLQGFIDQGLSPDEIFDKNIGFRRYDKMIKDAYYSKLRKETPFIREVNVFWHFGKSGSGKSYTAQKIINEIGEDNIYFVSDYDGGGFDHYNGQSVLFLDEFKGQIRFSTLLTICDNYKTQVHSRYTNVWTLWNEVHITSVYAPDEVYKKMVSDQKVDTVSQLLRRINYVVYHYIDNGEYKEIVVPASEYKDRATMTGDLWTDVSEYEYLGELPFE